MYSSDSGGRIDINSVGAEEGNTLVFDGTTWIRGDGPLDPNLHLTFLHNNVSEINELLFDTLSQTGLGYETVEFNKIHSSFNALPFSGSAPYDVLDVPPGTSYMKFKGNLRFGLDPNYVYPTLPYSSVCVGIIKNPISSEITNMLSSTKPRIVGNTAILEGTIPSGPGRIVQLSFESPWIPVTSRDTFAMCLLYYSPTSGITLRVYKDGTSLLVEHR